ncbi:BON domain-containing protein [Balneolaceae bacterium YR4-1]|uniref:BON domain-containing protein n=1 Tax=Halalkalibaculum roseum TaxID=2709311 RepID=A0A6M1STE5_9BACT|nr:BON domain-containing protein [Halalkalibaculum roseum]NGP76170.1 BON domain-containing protein [Halalkalibaculum roseum]
MRNDEDVKVDIAKQLKWDARIDASEVSIKVNNGKVELEGNVPTMTAKSAAFDDAYLVDGVLSVDNKLDVEIPSVKSTPTDSEIRDNVVTALSINSDVESYKIDVTVDKGWVTLEGTVNAYWEKVSAENEVLDINGVLGVSNNLGVVPTESYLDENIAEDIISALERNVHVNADDIDVKVEDGKVTLDGTVKTYTAKNAAFDSALYTPGVITVNNRIIVG